jgi:magnesium and cobalt transporter
VVTINVTASIDDALNLITGHGHSRIPVYKESSDRIIGVLYAKDLLASLRFGQRPAVIHTLMRPPFYVPELINIADLLRSMQTKRIHFAVVVDEYGATSGIVTLEDILEEIVGDIKDEFDAATLPDMVWTSPTELTVDARVLLDDINDQTGLTLSSETSDRIGGFIAEQLGRMSQIGDQVMLSDQTVLTVIAIDGIRTSRIRINVPTTLLQGGNDESTQPPTTH